ncbi:HvfX family Cu-binding RiPP maturation protein [Ketobacter sp.]|nr:MAG: DoxX family protein [Ketobacter sp.]
MSRAVNWINKAQDGLQHFNVFDFLAPLAFRLYLAPIFIAVGWHKLNHFSDIVDWFRYSLELPMPELMAFLATSAELLGGLALLAGVAVRWAVIPLMITMLVAAVSAHWDNGWFAIAPSDADSSIANVFAVIGFPGAEQSLQNSMEVSNRLEAARGILGEHGNYDWLTEKGSFVVLNNGIEFSVTYFIMLMSLFFTGAGRFVSLDYWIGNRFRAGSDD